MTVSQETGPVLDHRSPGEGLGGGMEGQFQFLTGTGKRAEKKDKRGDEDGWIHGDSLAVRVPRWKYGVQTQ